MASEDPKQASDGEDLREEFAAKIADVRERVVQVKREADAKAPADHGHSDLRRDVEDLRTAVAEIEELRDRVVENRDRMDDGFENYEEVLSYLTETTDELEERLDVLATALVAVRDRTRQLAVAAEKRAAVAELARTANRNGVETALCESCELSVTVSLLCDPECPHCGASFTDLRPKEGWFGSSTLLVGDPPALEGGTLGDVDDLLAEVDGE